MTSAQSSLVYVVRFEKTSAVLGPEPLGAAFEFVSRVGRPEKEQRDRAWRILKRDRPDENPMCWTITEVR